MIDILHKKYIVILLIWCFLIIYRFFTKDYIVLFKTNSYEIKGIYTWCKPGFGKYILFIRFIYYNPSCIWQLLVYTPARIRIDFFNI